MIGSFGGVYTLLQQGNFVESHAHDFDHLSLLTKGSVRVEWTYPDALWEKLKEQGKLGGRTKTGSLEFTAPTTFPVLAGVLHSITSILETPFEIWCIHATRDAEGIVIGAGRLEQYLGSDNV